MAVAASPLRAGLLPDGAFSSRASGTTGASFLKAPGGARASAMGGVSAAAGLGADAVFLSPTSISRFEPESPSELAFGYDALIETAYSGSAAYAHPLGRDGALAAGLLYASQDAQTGYNSLGDATGNFTPFDLALGVWYAHRLSSVALAGGVKLIRSTLAERSGTTGAADFGVRAYHVTDMGEGPLDLGLSLQHLGPPLKLGGIADPLPARVRAGGLWHVSPRFDAGLDLVFPVDEDPFVTLGVEARLPAAAVGSAKPWMASVRGGFDQNRTRGVEGFTGLSVGAGFDFSTLRLDYAWIAFGDLGSVNRLTIAFRF